MYCLASSLFTLIAPLGLGVNPPFDYALFVREAPRRSPLWLPLEIFPAPYSLPDRHEKAALLWDKPIKSKSWERVLLRGLWAFCAVAPSINFAVLRVWLLGGLRLFLFQRFSPAPGSVVEHTAPIIQRRVKAMATAPTIFTFRVDTLFYFLRHGLRSSSAFKKKAPAPSAGAFSFTGYIIASPPRKGWRAVAA